MERVQYQSGRGCYFKGKMTAHIATFPEMSSYNNGPLSFFFELLLTLLYDFVLKVMEKLLVKQKFC